MRFPLVALRAFPYGRLKLKPGDAFEALNQSDYALLTQIGHARSPDDPGVYRTAAPAERTGTPPDVGAPLAPRVVEPGETARPMTMKRGPGRPRKYARKDLEAE